MIVIEGKIIRIKLSGPKLRLESNSETPGVMTLYSGDSQVELLLSDIELVHKAMLRIRAADLPYRQSEVE